MSKQIYQYSLEGINLKDFEKYFKGRHKEYSIIQTSSSLKYDSHSEKFIFAKDYIGFGAMNIIKNLKIDVYKNLKDGKFEIKSCTPRYFSYNANKISDVEGFFYPVSELDINSAYLHSAYFQKIISENQYLKLKSVHKKLRLRALGALATTKTTTKFKDGELLETNVTQSRDGLDIWKMICEGTAEMIQMVIYENARRAFLFYWFDNLFLHSNTVKVTNHSLFKIKKDLSIRYQMKLGTLHILIPETQKSFALNSNFNF